VSKTETLSKEDSILLNYLKGLAILVVVLGHLGLGWIYLPYSSYTSLAVPLFFFCSGYLFFFLYKRRQSFLQFSKKRLLGVVLPYYIIYILAFAIALCVKGNFQDINLMHFIRMLFLVPTGSEVPFPMDQIWFLKVFLSCVIVAPFLLASSEKVNHHLILVALLLALIVATIEAYSPIHAQLIWNRHNFYQDIVYGAYFYAGLYLAGFDWKDKKREVIGLALILLVLSIAFNIVRPAGFDLGKHATAPTVFYLFLGVAFGLIVFCLHRQIISILKYNSIVSSFINYCGTHSFSIFLIHSFFIYFSEVQFGWVGVMHNPVLAVSKVTFVLVSSLIVAYPISWLCKKATALIS